MLKLPMLIFFMLFYLSADVKLNIDGLIYNINNENITKIDDFSGQLNVDTKFELLRISDMIEKNSIDCNIRELNLENVVLNLDLIKKIHNIFPKLKLITCFDIDVNSNSDYLNICRYMADFTIIENPSINLVNFMVKNIYTLKKYIVINKLFDYTFEYIIRLNSYIICDKFFKYYYSDKFENCDFIVDLYHMHDKRRVCSIHYNYVELVDLFSEYQVAYFNNDISICLSINNVCMENLLNLFDYCESSSIYDDYLYEGIDSSLQFDSVQKINLISIKLDYIMLKKIKNIFPLVRTIICNDIDSKLIDKINLISNCVLDEKFKIFKKMNMIIMQVLH